ncbi:MAG TPA: hypothetical protein VFX23_01400, partial [Limnobacter sp.]|nr:hypothetical protein [Limnobacter sp.]
MRHVFRTTALAATLCVAASLAVAATAGADTDWPVFGGNWQHQRHSELTQINVHNVNRLEPAWTFDTKVSGSF